MELRRKLLRACLYVDYGLRRLTGSGPFGPRRAVPVTENPPGIIAGTLQQALWRHYVKQFNEAACSVASVATVINALRAVGGSGSRPVRQTEILDRVTAGHWKARMGLGGHNGRRGLPLALLGEVVRCALAAYDIRTAGVETVAAPRRPGPAQSVRRRLCQRLHGFQTAGSGLIIAHFDQGVFLPTLNIPHISPVGAFDPHGGQVTVLDVDAEVANPYRIDFDTFYRGLASNYHHIYTGGGYIYIRLERSMG
ncbi:MAG: phytochelatin synthase [Deltaproteobacteria bacterium]|nr:phytochelatin synthase [Deltaproteobacteria bacterium]